MDFVPGKPKRGLTGMPSDFAKLPKCGAKARSIGKPCQRPAEHNVETG